MPKSAVVTRTQAAAVVSALEGVFPELAGQFALYDHAHEEMRPGCWSIACEGWGGDTPWPYMASERAFSEPDLFPHGVFLEPMTSWGLGLYPA